VVGEIGALFLRPFLMLTFKVARITRPIMSAIWFFKKA